MAYVEQVLSATKIIISEDSWSGDFHWRKLKKSERQLADRLRPLQRPCGRAGTRPVITGVPAVGRRLTATAGSWSQAATYSFQWLADGKAIAGARSSALTITPGLLRRQLSVKVGATERGYVPGSATSARTDKVARGTMTVTAAPVVSGTARVDEVLTVRPASWSPTPDATTVRWFANGEPIPGATGLRLHLDQDQIRQRITVRMRATAEGYKASAAVSDPTAPVAAGHIDVLSPFRLDGLVRMGKRLTVTPGTVDPADADVTYTWLRNGAAIPGATAPTYDLGVADVGKRISLRVDLSHTGYRDKTLLLTTDGRVTTAPVLHVNTTGRPGRAVVAVRVSAPGVETPAGLVTVRIGDHVVRGRLDDGRLRVVLDDLAAGTRTVKVYYAGTEVVRSGRLTTTVDVQRKGGQ